MSEKLLAGALAAVVIAPLCAACVFGPAFFGSAIAWVFASFNGTNSFIAVGLAIIASGVIFGLVRWKRVKDDAANDVAIRVSRAADSETQ